MFNQAKKALLALGSMLALTWSASSHAIPTLQMYIEGGTYNAATQTWVVTANDFTVWVIGNTGQVGNITGNNGAGGVTLVVSSGTNPMPSITFTPTFANGIIDPSLGTDPSAYMSGNGAHNVLAAHGIFNQPGVIWTNYDIGAFTLTDSQIGDATQGSYPTTPGSFWGQVNAYTVHVNGSFDFLHFDGYGYIARHNDNQNNDYVFAPFSHDAQANCCGDTKVPTPAGLPLLVFGSVLTAFALRRRK